MKLSLWKPRNSCGNREIPAGTEKFRWERTDDTLFVPRFDRATVEGRFQRYGLETVCSVAEITEFAWYAGVNR